MKRLTLLIIIILIMTGCSNVSEQPENEEENVTLYTIEEEKELLLNNTERFQELCDALLDNKYELDIAQARNTGEYEWLYSVSDDSKMLDITSNKEAYIDENTTAIIDNFISDFKCRGIICDKFTRPEEEWYVEVHFWDQAANNGIRYLPEGLNDVYDEYGKKYFERLSGNWYYYIFPAV